MLKYILTKKDNFLFCTFLLSFFLTVRQMTTNKKQIKQGKIGNSTFSLCDIKKGYFC